MNGLRKACSSVLVASALATIPAGPARAGQLELRLGLGLDTGVGIGAAASLAAPESDAAPAAVVGLETDWPEQGAALTQALRKAFAARGLSGGKEVDLAELRLALGCKGTSPKCLAKGGSVVGARRLIYGTLRRDAGIWALDVTLVEVDGGATTSASLVVTNAELAADRIGYVADEVVDRLAPDTVAMTTPGQGTGEPADHETEPADHEPGPADDHAGGSAREGKLWWGWVKPQPRWKLAGFGLGVTFSVLGLGTVVGTGVWLTSKNGGFRKQLIEAAENSLTDANELNDVDPTMTGGVGLCTYAAESTDPTMPSRVRNSEVTRVCQQGDDIERVQVLGGVVAGVGLTATAVFTLLLLLHRQPARASTWRRHRMQVGLDPAARGQGLSLRVGGRF